MNENTIYNKIKQSSNLLFYVLIGITIIFGIYLRAKLYLQTIPFWYDEMELGINFINKSIPEMFQSFDGLQKIPPLFGVCSLIAVKLFGFKVSVLRFIPFISGILALFGFFILLKNIYTNKITILFGMILFSLSSQIIDYSNEFKPYSSDILICILLLTAYKYISFRTITIKRIILYTLFSGLLVLFSLPAMFIIPAMVITKWIEEKKINYKTIIILSGVVIPALFMWLSDLNTFKNMVDFYSGGYCSGYLQLSFVSIYNLFDRFFNFYTLEDGGYKYSKILFVLFLLTFIFFTIKNKIYSLLSILIISIPSFLSLLKMYPMYERLLLWTMPLFIIVIISITDIKITKFKKPINYIITTIINILFIPLIFYLLTCNKIPEITISTDYPAEIKTELTVRKELEKLTLYLIDNIKENSDILATNEYNDWFLYYSKLYNKVKPVDIEKKLITSDIKEITEIINKFIDKNSEKEEYWIIGNENFLTDGYKKLIDLLNKRNLKYEMKESCGYFVFKVINTH